MKRQTPGDKYYTVKKALLPKIPAPGINLMPGAGMHLIYVFEHFFQINLQIIKNAYFKSRHYSIFISIRHLIQFCGRSVVIDIINSVL